MFVFNSTLHSAAAIQHAIDEMQRNSLTPVQGPDADDDSFGAKLNAAITRRFEPSSRIITAEASTSDDESFADKLTREIERKLGSRSQQAARDRAAKESSRYRKPQRRAASKSD